ncbi:MAG: hypothetical protein AB1633_06050 [Elusimicrobiota bacterium]
MDKSICKNSEEYARLREVARILVKTAIAIVEKEGLLELNHNCNDSKLMKIMRREQKQLKNR